MVRTRVEGPDYQDIQDAVEQLRMAKLADRET